LRTELRKAAVSHQFCVVRVDGVNHSTGEPSMQIPPVFAQARVLPLLVFAAFSVAAAAATAEPLLGAESHLKSESKWAESENGALAAEAEWQMLSTWQAKLERSFDAQIASQLAALSERVFDENRVALAATYDARMRQRDRLSARIDTQLAALSRAPGTGFDVFATGSLERIAAAPIPARSLPASPAP